jgi:putative transposase
MPWKIQSVVGERWRLVQALLQNQQSVKHWCRVFGVSRKTAYKWKARFLAEGRRALKDRSRRPQRSPGQLRKDWIGTIRRLRQKHPSWGPKKIRAQLQPQGRSKPSVRTIGRWLQRLQLTCPRRRRPRKACLRLHPPLTQARRPNQVWTVDFKGWFRAGKGERCEPLTVRDLFSRYGLLARVLATQQGPPVRTVFTALFQRYGLPTVIRVDNGSSFASQGPAGLSQLSAWWVRLGIRVEFTRPACPQDNGAHEQFHRVMKRETTQPPAGTRRGQQHRCTCWLRYYNQQRPHEALGQTAPAKWYHKSRRRFPPRLPEIHYGPGRHVRRVRSNGEIRWAGRKRFIGEAFVHQSVGLRPLKRGVFAVNFAHLLIGHLHEQDAGAMRPARYQHRRRPEKKAKVSPMSCPQSVTHVLSSCPPQPSPWGSNGI